MAEEIIGTDDAAVYKKDALNTVSFRIIYNNEDYESRRYQQFKPDMAHQVFGESETIYGYRSLSIQLFYTHNSLRCFLNVESSGKTESSEVIPDDIMGCMEPWLQDYTTEEKTFVKMLKNEKHDQIFGDILDEFEINDENVAENQKTNLKYKISLCNLQDDHFKEYHKRFETFIVWFIDAANLIDTEDERWMIFYVYEEFDHPKDNTKYVSPIGFCSVYKFFAYPDKIRPRISQFFVLPTQQRKGIGKKLYHSVAKCLREMQEVVDITVEEPTDTFQRIRDIDDCLELQKVFKESKIRVIRDNQKNVIKVMKALKVCKRQMQRLIDILGCFEAGKSGNITYQNYLEGIKQRMKADMERQSRGSKRIHVEEIPPVTVDHVDKAGVLEVDFKKYISDIEPSIKYLQKIQETNSNDH